MIKWISIVVFSVVVLFAPPVGGIESPSQGSSLELSSTSTIAVGSVQEVVVEVKNDQQLVALDIPIRFGRPGDPVTLDRVEWTSRVDGWDLRHAAIDNDNKTVILGLISDLTGHRKDSALAVAGEANASIATLFFRVTGQYRPTFEAFTTSNPTHALTFIYNEYDRHGRPHVVEFTPDFHVDLREK